MAYKTKSGQTVLDVMIQNKGSLDPNGLTEFIGDLTAVTDEFFSGEELNIDRESNPVTNLYDTKDLTAVSVSSFMLEPPSNLAVDTPTLTSLNLTWVNNSTGESSIGIERSLVLGGLFVQITTVGAGATTYTDNDLGSDLDPITKYFYRVRALGAVPSEYSNIDSAFTLSLASGSEAVYALRRRTDFPGSSLMTIRRSSDNSLTNLLLGDNGDFITLSNLVSAGGTLGTWVGANDAFIRGWGAQEESGLNLFVVDNTTASTQPQIISSGVINTKNGNPAADFDVGVGVHLELPGGISSLALSNDFSIMTVSNSNSTGASADQMGILHTGAALDGSMTMSRISDAADSVMLRLRNTVPTNFIGFMSGFRNVTDQVLHTIINDGTGSLIDSFDNGSSGTQNLAYSGTFNNDRFGIGRGRADASNNDLDGNIQEIVIYASDKSASRVAIETEISSTFSIP